jgi:arabinofuranosyltransferase
MAPSVPLSRLWLAMLGLVLLLAVWGTVLCILDSHWSRGVLHLLAAASLGYWLRNSPERRMSVREAGVITILSGLFIWWMWILPDFLRYTLDVEFVAWNMALAFGLLILARVGSKQLAAWLGLAGAAGYNFYAFFSQLPSFLWLRFGLSVLGLMLLFFWSVRNVPRVKGAKIRPEWILGLAVLSLIVLVIRNAWVCDDAYITFRTVDNFIHGYGLRWNIAERVQTYTHPLWMLLLSAVYVFTHELHYTSMILGLILATAAVTIVVTRLSRNIYAGLAAVLLLAFSKAFVDFSTSGLENSLTYLLLAVFYWIYFQGTPKQTKTLLWLSLIAALATVNRMDTILLFLPGLAYSGWQCWRPARWKVLLTLGMGFLPFLLWELFSLVYYGFPFPNTAYAKLGIMHSLDVTYHLSLTYMVHNLGFDPVTLLSIAAGLILVIRLNQLNYYAAMAGILFYLAYILSIGGDFMSGRFLAGPLLVAVICLCREGEFTAKSSGYAVAALTLLSLVSPYHPWRSDADYSNMSFPDLIADERGFYYSVTGLLRATPNDVFCRKWYHPMMEWIDGGEAAAKRQEPFVMVQKNIGVLGFLAGPRAFIVDEYALCDPLLARMPPVTDKLIRSGHLRRRLPSGYLDSLASGQNKLLNPDLDRYYAKLSEITRAPIFSPSRWQAIIAMNSGRYQDWVNLDFYAQPQPDWFRLCADKNDRFNQEFLRAVRLSTHALYASSERVLKSLLEQYPDKTEVVVQLGTFYQYMGQPGEAVKYYQLANKRSTTDWGDYYTQFMQDWEQESQAGGIYQTGR